MEYGAKNYPGMRVLFRSIAIWRAHSTSAADPLTDLGDVKGERETVGEGRERGDTPLMVTP